MFKAKLTIDVYYDSWCPMCTSIKTKIDYLDWFHLINFVTFRNNNINIDICEDVLEERMHAKINRSGKILTDVDAFSSIAIRIPLLIPMYFVFKISIILGFGTKLYNFIAKNRRIVPVGHCDGECFINKGK